ncbi:type II secretion system protein [Pseudothermotoga thermarum]|uniref:Prepilin-type N-terminal cleavage/methylation domain-containing protein n=1 Tax=Pseudothermotoga thermarum DSM 5069 TaxID=688269 RepID=F7YXL7_9THEM|nr:hypothetical protein [Pseudothermotoga thermarum]AEH50658.1 hypothetical protein Theth_0569 [Pseudothermotoga thermarum DSM 5069]
MKKAFTVLEIVIVIAVFAVFTIVFALVINDYLKKAQQHIQILETIRQLTETANSVIRILSKASGSANSINVSEKVVQFQIIIPEILGTGIINCKLISEEDKLIYLEEEQMLTIPTRGVTVTFDPSTSLPIKFSVEANNPMNPNSKISMTFSVYPPGIGM